MANVQPMIYWSDVGIYYIIIIHRSALTTKYTEYEVGI